MGVHRLFSRGWQISRGGGGLKTQKIYHFPQERLKIILFWSAREGGGGGGGGQGPLLFSPAGDHTYAYVKFYFEKQLLR